MLEEAQQPHLGEHRTMATPKTTKGKEKETLGHRLARLRKQHGTTQVELADKLGIGQSNVSDYERDICRPNADMVLRIAEALNLSTDELLGHRRAAGSGPAVSRRLMKRMLEIEKLPRRDQQAIIRTIDAFLAKAG